MLDNISNEINAELLEEEDRQDFYDLIHEDVDLNKAIDKILNLDESEMSDKMLKTEMPFLFIEDTTVDNDLVTKLQAEVEYEDDYEKKAISDSDELTRLQEPEDYDDDFDLDIARDADADTDLDREVDYDDNRTTPVDVDPYGAEELDEAADLLIEMGNFDIFDEDECCDMTVPNIVPCPDEGEKIDQAEEADVDDTEYPDLPEGVVMEADEEEMPEGDDADAGELDEDFFLFEDADEDEEFEDDEDEEKPEDDEDEEEDEEDDDVCPDCGKNPCECDKEVKDDDVDDECGNAHLKECYSMSEWFDL